MFRARLPRASRMAGMALSCAALAIACAGYDLAISRAVVQPECAWAAFGQRFSELPGLAAFTLATLMGLCPVGRRPGGEEARRKAARGAEGRARAAQRAAELPEDGK